MAELSDDEELKAAIAMSLANASEMEKSGTPSATSRDIVKPEDAKGDIRDTLKSLGEARLARAAANRKRERSISPPRSSRKAPKLETIEPEASINTASSTNTASLQYPKGVVKKTWSFGHPRTGSDVKLEEVLEAQTLKIAVLSAYQWDVEWVLAKLKTPLRGGTTKCIFVMQAKEHEDRELWRKQSEYMSKFLRLCFPAMHNPINCMHSKLMLLFHPNKLRIAIPTANLLNFDWGETGQMENSVFMIDLPRLAEAGTSEGLTFFGKELMFFLEMQGLDQDVRTGLLNFDFAATEGMAFIHTAGGIHYQEDADRTGLFGLSHAVNELDLATDDLEIDFAASSIGQLNDKYLRDLQLAAKGDMKNLATQAAAAKSKATKDFFKPKTATQTKSLRETVSIYFPTKETVKASTAGSAGTLCLNRKYFEAGTFPRSCFRDYKSTRPGMLSHNKILCARGKKKSPSGDIEDVAWVYVGSSNVSKSAWGELPADRTVKRITCRNWECGVLLPVPKDVLVPPKAAVKVKNPTPEGEDSETESEAEEEVPAKELVGMHVFKGIIDLPFEMPGSLYQGREPYYFKEDS